MKRLKVVLLVLFTALSVAVYAQSEKLVEFAEKAENKGVIFFLAIFSVVASVVVYLQYKEKNKLVKEKDQVEKEQYEKMLELKDEKIKELNSIKESVDSLVQTMDKFFHILSNKV